MKNAVSYNLGSMLELKEIITSDISYIKNEW